MSPMQVLPEIAPPVQQQAERSFSGRDLRTIGAPSLDAPTPVTLKSLVPGVVLVGHLLDPRLRVVVPFLVQFTPDKDQVVAEISDFNEFGFGANALEALGDAQHAVAELFFELEAMKEKLGPDLLSVRDALRSRIRLA